MSSHPRHDLDPVLESPIRLSIVAALAEVERADFATVRDTIAISDSALSKQLTHLEDVEYVVIDKERAGRRTKTWLSLTETGDQALRSHLDALQRIVDSAARRGAATTDR
ncbi:transcriptional regulator [Haloactinopolyspora sp.]|uniref:transcriptional regulator n=1 Tax=Haloactinopolyspora sp. TaxID=1966353 RepID=UPI00261E8938|nr:transcriptional regulator [Haloactinopolyspora sp.]